MGVPEGVGGLAGVPEEVGNFAGVPEEVGGLVGVPEEVGGLAGVLERTATVSFVEVESVAAFVLPLVVVVVCSAKQAGEVRDVRRQQIEERRAALSENFASAAVA